MLLTFSLETIQICFKSVGLAIHSYLQVIGFVKAMHSLSAILPFRSWAYILCSVRLSFWAGVWGISALLKAVALSNY